MSIKRYRITINTQNGTKCKFCALLRHSVPFCASLRPFYNFFLTFCAILCYFWPFFLCHSVPFCAFIIVLCIFIDINLTFQTHSVPFCAILCLFKAIFKHFLKTFEQFCAVLCYSVSLRPFLSVLFHLLSNSGLFLAFSFSFNAILCSFVPLLWFCASLLTLIFSIYTHSVPFCAALCHSVPFCAQNGTERHRKGQ